MNAELTLELVGRALLVAAPGALRDDAGDALRAAGFTVVEKLDVGVEVIVLCSGTPAPQRIADVAEAARDFPDSPIVTTMPAESSGRQLRQAIREGARGIVLDDCVEQVMAPTTLAALSGQLAVPMSVARRIAPRALSHREKEVMGLVVQGYTNRQIARQLYVAESTVKTHLSSALRKLDARSRSEAAALVLDPEEGHGMAILALVPSTQKLEALTPVD